MYHTSRAIGKKASKVQQGRQELTRQNTYQFTKSCFTKQLHHICTHPIVFSLSAFNCRSNDVSYKENTWSEGIESSKSDGNRAERFTYHSTQNQLAKRSAAGSTPLQSYCHHQHSISNWLMYRTGATMGEKTSNQQKVTATQQTIALTSVQKIVFRHKPPDLRHAKAIAVIVGIQFCIDWCIIQAQPWVRRRRINKKWRRHSRQAIALTVQKIVFRHKPPDLRHAKAIAFIVGIQFCIDWCIIQAQQWVRRHRINKQWQQHRTQQHLPLYKKSFFDTSRRIYATPKLLPSLAFNSAFIDVYNTHWNWWEWNERQRKGNSTTVITLTNFYQKKTNFATSRKDNSSPIGSI